MRTFTVFATILFGAVAAAQELSSHGCPELPGTRLPLPAGRSSAACTNGDFEKGLEAAEWFGQHGAVTRKGEPVFFVEGLLPGSLTSCGAHQTAIAAELDPIAGISTVAPGGSANAVRIGNAAPNSRADMLGKRFIVDAARSVISFSYAVVMQDPHHLEHQQPSFEVRVLDSAGELIPPGLVDLGNGSNKLIAGDPFLDPVPGGGITFHKNWTCARIDLSSYAGTEVTVLFIIEDCTLGAHYAYAYVDDFCGGGQCGPSLTFERADECGAGEACFRYVPFYPDERASFALRVLQGGEVVDTLDVASITDDTICFPIDPATLKGLKSGVEAFDLAASATFTTPGGAVTVVSAGSGTEGVRPGLDNDYLVSCGTPGCCTGAVNVIANGDFELGKAGFDSDYDFEQGPYTANAVKPGEYAILDSASAADVASTWRVSGHAAVCPNDGKFLVVNGETHGGGGSGNVWSQRAVVVPGSIYRFCARVLNLPQAAFNVEPAIVLRVSSPSTTVEKPFAVTSTGPCDWMLVDLEVAIPLDVTSVTAEIWLKDEMAGDGNDLAIDDVGLHRLAASPPAATQLGIVTSPIENGTYGVAATPVAGRTSTSFTWELCEVDGRGDCVPETWILMTDALPGTFDFAGRRFDILKKYRITYAVDDSCTIGAASTWELEFNPAAATVMVTRR